MISITLNGESLSLEPQTSVSALLEKLELDVSCVAVERNLAIVSKSTFDTTLVDEGDQLEIVHFIGGG